VRFELRACYVALLSAPLLAGSARAAPPNFIEFESGHVRPIAMSPGGTQLFAVNTPNDTAGDP